MAKKIMVVDDSKSDVLLIQTILEKRGYEVVSTTDSRLAMDVAKREKPDLLILDIMMPEMDGTELGQKFQDNRSTRHIPIVFLTALQRKEEEDIYEDNSKRLIFAKPVNPDVFVGRIDQILND